MSTAEGQLGISERTSRAIADVLAGRNRSWSWKLLFAGPAVVASIAYMDPGNFATNIQAGSKYGYSFALGCACCKPHRHVVPGALGKARHRH